jgi:plastocyanin
MTFALPVMVLAAGCSKSSKSSSSTSTTAATQATAAAPVNQGAAVKISEFAFTGQSVTIKAGQSVLWTNDGSVAHTVTDKSGTAFNSPSINPGQTYVQTFNKAGTYQYICSIHPDKMHGTVVVTASS